MKTILLVDDEVKLLKIIGSSLGKKGYQVYTASNGDAARKILDEKHVDVVFLDLVLADENGLELLQKFHGLYPQKVYIIMTAYGDIPSAVSAMKEGAFDYLVKPVSLEEIVVIIEKAFQWLQINEENRLLRDRLSGIQHENQLIGTSEAMKKIFQLVERVANTDATVFIQGESGTGKSVVARMIHDLSERRSGPFVSINCAAIPEQLLESELFGYEKGAFTGAHASRPGKFEVANGGTIFLDEIGELSPSLQAKLLHVIQEKSFMRLGSSAVRRVDVRIISATNQDLYKMVGQGLFREDLYYRLRVVDIYIPPLRERREDIPILAEAFLDRHRKRYNKNVQISRQLMEILTRYHWPGNVRELENAIERAVVLCHASSLSIEDFPREIRENRQENPVHESISVDSEKSLPERLEEIEKQFIVKALEESNGQAASAARKLGISRQSLLYKMNKYLANP